MNDLLPCPLCRGTPWYDAAGSLEAWGYDGAQVRCFPCGLALQAPDDERAIARWNRRDGEPPAMDAMGGQ